MGYSDASGPLGCNLKVIFISLLQNSMSHQLPGTVDWSSNMLLTFGSFHLWGSRSPWVGSRCVGWECGCLTDGLSQTMQTGPWSLRLPSTLVSSLATGGRTRAWRKAKGEAPARDPTPGPGPRALAALCAKRRAGTGAGGTVLEQTAAAVNYAIAASPPALTHSTPALAHYGVCHGPVVSEAGLQPSKTAGARPRRLVRGLLGTQAKQPAFEPVHRSGCPDSLVEVESSCSEPLVDPLLWSRTDVFQFPLSPPSSGVTPGTYHLSASSLSLVEDNCDVFWGCCRVKERKHREGSAWPPAAVKSP